MTNALPLLTRRATPDEPVTATLALTFDQRQRARLRLRLEDGREVGLLLQRGDSPRAGDRFATADGELVCEIRAAAETLSVVYTDDPLLLARACYHLGNRHVSLQIGPGRLAWLHDHVLDAMVDGLGLRVRCEQAPFAPEPGAYQEPGAPGHHHHEHGY